MHLDKVHKGYLYLGIFLVLIGALGAIGPKEPIPLIWFGEEGRGGVLVPEDMGRWILHMVYIFGGVVFIISGLIFISIGLTTEKRSREK